MSWFLVSGVGTAALVLDVASKAWASNALDHGSLEVTPFLALHLAHNSGMSFSMFASGNPLVLSALSALLIAGLTWMTARARLQLERSGLALIIGGALGNLLDRLHDGLVTDFIHVHAGAWHFPTFNLADVAISAGVLVILRVTIQDTSRR